ncbi:hypothetical protein JQ594_15440 [Bradyrhizobium manausense]|uniref:hypothetical protein n=1 Tax=Bradyrhizobium manausense TaxID=989370 RepID=UPI001BAE479D|nr:hypothetical protein [Bradyrhizobium manausense]MBR0687324.1 hypothetical protein [Bradyrhizobium manausense]
MSIELHDNVVGFRAVSPGRERIVLGRVQVGEIGPAMDPRSRFPICFRLELPDASSKAWQPARDVADARRQAAEKVKDWMVAAGLAPIGATLPTQQRREIQR